MRAKLLRGDQPPTVVGPSEEPSVVLEEQELASLSPCLCPWVREAIGLEAGDDLVPTTGNGGRPPSPARHELRAYEENQRQKRRKQIHT